MKGTVAHELVVPAPAGEVWAIYGSLRLGQLAPELLPGVFEKVELVEGDGGEGTVLSVTLAPSAFTRGKRTALIDFGGSSEPFVYKEKFVKVDTEKLVKVTEVVEGAYLDLGFRLFRLTLEIIEGSGAADSCVIRSSVDYDIEEGSEQHAGLVTIDAFAALAEAIRNYLCQQKPA